MPSWTLDHSIILSLLLGAVVGTKEVIKIRQDCCRIRDCLESRYFTGSKSEGLDLPGNDEDYMFDINKIMRIKVTQSLYCSPGMFTYNTFFMSSESVPSGFALLQPVHQTVMSPFLCRSLQYMYGVQWRSSAPKSGGGGAQTFFSRKAKSKKKKKKKKGHSGV